MGMLIISCIVTGTISALVCGAIMYLCGWEKGWDDSKHFTHITLDALSDEGIILVVREMAKKFREEGAKDGIAEETEEEV